MAIADFNGLAQLKVKAKANEKTAMQETARQFEALFAQTMLKTMRSSQHFIDEDSPFRSQAEDTFQEMLDAQYAQHISQGDGIGLAKVLVAQMSAQQDKTNPSSAIRIAEDVKPMSQKEGHVGINTQKHSSLSINPAERQQEVDTKQDKFSLAEFIKPLLPYAQKAAAILGVDPKILLAQVALVFLQLVAVAGDAGDAGMHGFAGEREAKELDAHQEKADREGKGPDPHAEVELGAELVERHVIGPALEEELPRIPGPDEADRRAGDDDGSRQDVAPPIRDDRSQDLDINVSAATDQPRRSQEQDVDKAVFDRDVGVGCIVPAGAAEHRHVDDQHHDHADIDRGRRHEQPEEARPNPVERSKHGHLSVD
mgnify:CR=1 FL=1